MSTERTRFTLGMFTSVAQAENVLKQAEMLREVNKSVLRSAGIILDSPEYRSSDGVNEYALKVMEEQSVTLQDIEDIKVVIEEMRELEGMMRSGD